ncbi:MAG: acetaldehyde dehydrogenase (acetylating) [Acidobacteriota bacterium]|nr:acetaldehyde dehydrogenase (acetylating) [Acidobacteriota bacterium]
MCVAEKEDTLTKVAIIGSGNIGTDLMIKILRNSRHLELAAFVGIDRESEGLARARRLGIATTHHGVQGFSQMPEFGEVELVFDATSAASHSINAAICGAAGQRMIDLTPAAIGPFVVPVVNLEQHLQAPNINMVTCGGQATIPIVAAVARVAPVLYAEIVASISSVSAGPGTRANIDEFTRTTAHALERVGGAALAKAMIILNPADPPIIMRDTVYCLVADCDREAIEESVQRMVAAVQGYVPGYRLKQAIQFERLPGPVFISGLGEVSGTKITVFLEVEGAAHYLPSYAGNLDIMTSAALAAGERLASTHLVSQEALA